MRRFGSWVRGIVDGLSPGQLFALLAAIAFVVAFAAGLLLVELTESVWTDHPSRVVSVDLRVHNWFVAQRTPWLTSFFRFMTTLGNTTTIIVVVSLAVGLLIAFRLWFDIAFLLAATIGTSILTTLMKSVVGRGRPELVDRLVTATGNSFPSGHSSQAVACYGALAYLASRHVTSRRARIWIGLTAAVLIFLIGISRVYLGVHWPSDVIAGWSLGLCWLAGLILAVNLTRWLRWRRGLRAGLEEPDLP